LRIRHLGKRRIQTIKLPVNGQIGLQTCGDRKRYPRDVPDLAQIPDEETKAWLRDRGVADALAPYSQRT